MKQQQVQYWYSDILWYFDGECHRDVNLPAIYHFQNGRLWYVVYYQHNKGHRATGPARIDYKFKNKEYWYQGRKYDSLKEVQMMKACL